MKKILSGLAMLAMMSIGATAQVSNPSIISVTTLPVSCTTGFAPTWLVISTGLFYTCQAGVPTLVAGSGTFSALTGDATSTATGGATTVVGIQGHAIAAPTSAGYAYWNGSAWVYQTPSGSGTVTTSGSPVSPNVSCFSSATAITPCTSANIQTALGAATGSVNGYLTYADWNTFNGKQAALGFTPYNATNPAGYITSSSLSPYLFSSTASSTYAPIFTLTTTGSSGAATYSGNVLNIPQYAGGGSMTWPATAGVTVCTGTPCTAWGTSLGTYGSGNVLLGSSAVGSAAYQASTYFQAALTNPVTGPGSGATVGHLAVMGNTAGTAITDGGAVPIGTVTHTSGALTALAVMVGNGAADATVDTGCSTDGAGALTCASITSSSTTPGKVSLAAGTGNIPALSSNSAGFAAPVSGGTSYLLKLPATITAGILHAAAPATGDGVNESAMTSSLVAIADLAATGTPGSTNYLRGDNTWNVPPGTYSLPTATTSVLGGVLLGATGGANVYLGYTPANCTAGTTGSDCLTLSSGLVTVPNGGTGLATLTAHAVQVGEGTSTPAQVGPDSVTTHFLASGGSSTDPAFRAIASGDLPAATPTAAGAVIQVANTTFTTSTGSVSANTCNSAVQVAMTGVTTSMAFIISASSDTSGITGWGSTGGLILDVWPTAGYLNYKICNQTALTIASPGAVTFNVGAR